MVEHEKITDYLPPEHLSDRAKLIWRSVVPTRCKSPERLLFLEAALDAHDRAHEAAKIIAVEGMLTTTARTGVKHANPMVKIERESREQFAKLWKAMNLQFSPQVDGRI